MQKDKDGFLLVKKHTHVDKNVSKPVMLGNNFATLEEVQNGDSEE